MGVDSHILSSEELAALVKRHTHDLRNILNGIEMELMLLAETADENEKAAAVKRVRREMRTADVTIRSFAAKFLSETKTSVCVSDIAEQWVSDARILLPDHAITWDISTGEALIDVHVGLLRSVLNDMLVLACRNTSQPAVRAGCRCDDEQAVFEVFSESGDGAASSCDELQQLSWSILRQFSARNGGVLEPPNLAASSKSLHRLIQPLSTPPICSRSRTG